MRPRTTKSLAESIARVWGWPQGGYADGPSGESKEGYINRAGEVLTPDEVVRAYAGTMLRRHPPCEPMAAALKGARDALERIPEGVRGNGDSRINRAIRRANEALQEHSTSVPPGLHEGSK